MTTKRSVLVTGANKGIGREIARQLGLMDHHVWLGCRDEARGRQAEAELRAEGVDADFLSLDVVDEASVTAAAARVSAEAGVLDILVNNAGVGGDYASPPSTERIDDIRTPFEVNFFGTVRVTQAFVPLLRKSAAGRIVMVSSGLGSIDLTSDFTSPIWPMHALGYAASKTAVNMFTVKLAKELLADGIKVNAACPGSVDTDLSDAPGLRTVEEGARAPVRLATLDWMGPTGGLFHDGEGPGLAPYGW